jgi:hypothetical protein
MPKRRPDESLPPVQFSEVTGLDEVMQPRQPGRSRVVVAGLVGLALIIIAVGLIQRQLPFLNFTAITVTTSSSTDGAPTNRSVQLQTNINYGVLLNGQPISVPPGANFLLPSDTDQLSLQAPPFQPLTCTVTWPPDQGNDNCQSNGTSSDGSGNAVYTITFQVGLDDLPSDQRNQVSQIVLTTTQQAAASVQLQVPVGDYYPYAYAANGLPLSRRATAPLIATLSADDLATNTCGEMICPDNGPIDSNYQMQAVSFSINPDYSWHFTRGATAIGTFSLTDPVNTNAAQLTQPLSIGLTYSAAQGWQPVTPFGQSINSALLDQSNSNVCFSGANALTQELDATYNTNYGFGFPHVSAQGCQIAIYHANAGSPDATFIDRFGAVLAADSGAHKLLPSLPMAPKDEILATENSS